MNQVWHCVVYCLLHLKSLLSTVVVYIKSAGLGSTLTLSCGIQHKK